VLAGGDLLDEDCVDFGTAVRPAGPQALPGAAAAGLHLKANVDVLERGLIERALAEAGGNRTRAAALLGLSRYGLLKKLQRGVREAASGSRASSRAPAGSPRK
jgi:DNA-binding NtrC family response regulator